jgi:hypothetical protein
MRTRYSQFHLYSVSIKNRQLPRHSIYVRGQTLQNIIRYFSISVIHKK